MPAQSKIALRAFGADDMEKRHASGVDDTFAPSLCNQFSGGISVNWVAELIAASSMDVNLVMNNLAPYV